MFSYILVQNTMIKVQYLNNSLTWCVSSPVRLGQKSPQWVRTTCKGSERYQMLISEG